MTEIEIRSVTENDAEELLRIYAYYVEKTAISFEYEVPSLTEFRQRIRNTLLKYPYLAAVKNGQIVGYAYAGAFKKRAAYDHCAELTIYLDRSCRKQGIGRTLYAALEQRLKEQGIINMYACIGYPDVEDEYLTMNSMNFHSHMGFVVAGRFIKCGYKFNRWYNMAYLEKMIAEHKV